MFINRFAKVFAAILLLLFALTLKKEVDLFTPVFDPELSKNLIWFVIVFLILWVIISLKISKEYYRIIREKIKIKWPNAYKDVAKKMAVLDGVLRLIILTPPPFFQR